MRFGIAFAVVLIGVAGACSNSSNETLPSAASQPRLTSPTASPSANGSYITESKDRIRFRYPSTWRLQTTGPGGSIIWIYSADYKDDGGMQIQTIQHGARIVIGQTDIPQQGVTAENYGSNATLFPFNATDGKVIVINGRNDFQYRQPMAPWFDSVETVFFRDDGTRVTVDISYPSGQDDSLAADYAQLLASVSIE